MWLLAGLCAGQLRGRVGDNDQRVVVGVEGGVCVGGWGGVTVSSTRPPLEFQRG